MEITVNVCKCLIVSLVLINNSTIFVYFSWCPVCLWICHGTKSVYFTVPTGRIYIHSSSWGYRYTHSAAQSLKRFKPLPVSLLLWQGHCWIGKCTNKEFKLCLWCLKSDQVAHWNSCLFLISVNVWAIFSLRDCQQITYIMLNRFCPLSNLPSPPPLPCS